MSYNILIFNALDFSFWWKYTWCHQFFFSKFVIIYILNKENYHSIKYYKMLYLNKHIYTLPPIGKIFVAPSYVTSVTCIILWSYECYKSSI